MNHRPSISLKLFAAVLYLFLWAPIVVVVLYSFNAAQFGFAWTGFTTRWYRSLWENDAALAAARVTLLLAVFSTAISTVLGTLLAYGMDRFHFRGERLFTHLLRLPVFIPDIILAVALVLFFNQVRSWTGWLQPGLLTMVIGHVTFQIPFVAIVVRARLMGIDRSLEEAAHDLGADGLQTFLRVTLPLALPGVIAGAMLAFTLSLDDFVVSFFTAGPGSTSLPILIYASVKRGITPDINALSSLIILASLLAAGAFLVFERMRRP